MTSTSKQRSILALAVSAALAVGSTAPARAQIFPAEIELRDLDGTNGFILNGATAFDNAGRSVSTAGDVNGDGIDDLIIGADRFDANGEDSGRSYVVFGSASGFPNPFELSSLDGSNGFALDGAAGERSGDRVSAAGDINGDGIGDLIVAASRASANGGLSGRCYVVFGSNGGFPSTLDLSTLDGTNGFVLIGEAPLDRFGISVSEAGDINDDGFDDLIIGAHLADPSGTPGGGRSYVLFGSDTAFASPFDLTTLDGTNGFVLNGAAEFDQSGYSVSSAGDINGDGIDDLLIGALRVDANGDDSGRSYVVFGTSAGFPAAIELMTLNGTNGFALNGEADDDRSGRAVAAAGDFNSDGIDDLLIGAYRADANGVDSGRSYVVFGSTDPFPSAFELSALTGENGVALNGESAGNRSGSSVAGVGDVNGDGFEDLLIGAPAAAANGVSGAGRSYLVFGTGNFLLSPVDLSSLNGANGVALNGRFLFGESGASVSGAGDINGDGVSDLIIGAPYANVNGNNSGRAYVVFGTDRLFSDRFELAPARISDNSEIAQ